VTVTQPPLHTEKEPESTTTPQLNFDIPDALLAEVDFKWLMAGHGWQIDTAKLGCDPEYAAHVLQWALDSDSPALRQCAMALQAQIESARTSSKD
jgi:hypothetical protein